MSITATKEFKWDMAHMLDGHEGLCKNLHGHTYRMEVTVTSTKIQTEGPAEGMICDFKELKEIVNRALISKLDHATMINMYSEDEFEKSLYKLLLQYGKKVIPVEYRPTAENMAGFFLMDLNRYLAKQDKNYRVSQIKLYETPTSYAIATR